MTPVMSLEDVHAGYGRTRILNGIELAISGKETVAVLGPNGSGKSTVAKTIMNLTTLYEGRIVWKGQDVSRSLCSHRARIGIGYVPQTDNVFRGLTINDNLLMGVSGVRRRAERQRRASEMYELFPALHGRRDVLADKLSGGERRMLSFATALVQRPELLVLDEPTSDLAPTVIDQILDKIVEVRDELHVPILLIEQNVWRALELADHVCLLVRGRIVVNRVAGELDEDEIARVFLERQDQPGADG